MAPSTKLTAEYVRIINSLLRWRSLPDRLEHLVRLISGEVASAVFLGRLEHDKELTRLKEIETNLSGNLEWPSSVRRTTLRRTLEVIQLELRANEMAARTLGLPPEAEHVGETTERSGGPMESVNRLNRLYFLLLALVIASLIFLFTLVRDAKLEVQVTFEVGTIIAGILAGGGIAAAGTAYAVRAMRDDQSKQPPPPSAGAA